MKLKKLLSALSCALLSSSLLASPYYAQQQQIVIAPHCFYQEHSSQIKLLAKDKYVSLFSAATSFLDKQKTILEKTSLHCSHYFNVSKSWQKIKNQYLSNHQFLQNTAGFFQISQKNG